MEGSNFARGWGIEKWASKFSVIPDADWPAEMEGWAGEGGWRECGCGEGHAQESMKG